MNLVKFVCLDLHLLFGLYLVMRSSWSCDIIKIEIWSQKAERDQIRVWYNNRNMFQGTIWYEPRDHVVTQPTIKIEIWSRKAEIGLIGVWHNGNLSQGTNTIGLSRMTPRSQLIFDKSDSVRSRTEECKNHSHTLKLKNLEVIILKAAEI